jgi:hydrogenase nickel incorporation protein HypA/HybF
MHEFSITQEIVRIVNERASDLGATQVIGVELVVGALAGVVPDSVAFYFEHLAQGTVCQGADLRFTRIDARAICRSCQAAFTPQEYDWSCPDCGGLGADVVAGKELAVASIEVNDP